MQLIDRQRRIMALALLTGLHPLAVLPVNSQGRGNPGRGIRWQLRGQGHGVGLERQDAVGAEDFILVGLARLQARHKQLPYAVGMAQAHGVATAVPAVEITHHRDAPRIRRPHGKAHPRYAIDMHQLRPEAAT